MSRFRCPRVCHGHRDGLAEVGAVDGDPPKQTGGRP